MKPTALAAAFGAVMAAPLGAEAPTAKQVTVLGRDWLVAPVETVDGRYSATRMNLEHKAFRPPAVLSARQAARALRAATGCSVNLDSMQRNITGTYYAQMICRKGSDN